MYKYIYILFKCKYIICILYILYIYMHFFDTTDFEVKFGILLQLHISPNDHPFYIFGSSKREPLGKSKRGSNFVGSEISFSIGLFVFKTIPI